MLLPFDRTHDLDLVVSRSKFEKALFEEWDGWLTWHERGVSRSFMAMTVTYPIGNHGGVGGCTT